ncbi:MAG: undecaprenyl-diphosphate phosphatase [Lachnospiraceae bacterium]|nr:undecaprenyl-diphosphate phosphatase [Lachnospiraceae bacterium]MDD7327849.1 undecaprenyl-diphosphate phosphatase [Lachnospiraceae bacterium]MDY2760071.1 undecaprenyl-diphosphate phosphatase [Lachnospiraceae bacterium]
MQAFLEILKAALFGIVEGITEWLPISSTGHMILIDSTPLRLNVSDEFYSMFEVVIQLGAIMAVVITFWNRLWPWYLKKEKIPGRMASRSVPAWKKGAVDMWLKIIICCIPAAVVGLLFNDQIDALFYHPLPVALALIIVGIIFIIVENTIAKREPEASSIAEMSFMMVWWIGVAQTIAAIFPGTSRSGATIIGALIVGVSREAAAEFTFFLAVPVMLGASLLKVVKYIHAGVHMTGIEGADLAVGCIVAFVVSMIVIRFFMGYIRKHDFKVFGWYRIALGALVIVLAASKVIS